MELEANPQFYDYLHRISLYEDGSCRFADGGGQCVNLVIDGEFSLGYDNNEEDSGYVKFYFDTEYEEGCEDERKFNKQFKVNFKVQKENFIFVDEIVWNSTMENRDISIYNKRYVFDVDPFEGLYRNRESNLYFILEGDNETEDSLRYFYNYNDKVSKKVKDLDEKELDKLKEIKPDLYKAFIEHPTLSIREYMKLHKNDSDEDDQV